MQRQERVADQRNDSLVRKNLRRLRVGRRRAARLEVQPMSLREQRGRRLGVHKGTSPQSRLLLLRVERPGEFLAQPQAPVLRVFPAFQCFLEDVRRSRGADAAVVAVP